jgi:phage tail sheath protein FI
LVTQVSPGVHVSEIDLTTVVPGVQSSTGAIAGVFHWGPVGEPVLVDSEENLVARFHTPSNFNGETWFTAASFLSYARQLWVVRAANTTSTNTSISVRTAFCNTASVANTLAQVVKSETDYNSKVGTFDLDIPWLARYPGALGNSLRVSMCLTPNDYHQAINLASYGDGATFAINVGSNTATITLVDGSVTDANTQAQAILNLIANSDQIEVGNTLTGIQYMKVTGQSAEATGNTTTGTGTVTLEFEDMLRTHTDVTNSGELVKFWEYFSLFGSAPGTSDSAYAAENVDVIDELHMVVVDHLGYFTGVPGTVLETYNNLSRASDARSADGGTQYYKEVVNQRSNYLWWANHLSGAPANTANQVANATTTEVTNLLFSEGSDGANEQDIAIAALANAYDLYKSTEDITVDLVMTGKSRGGIGGSLLGNYLIDNIAEIRKDCVVFVSPDYADVVFNKGRELADIISFRSNLRSTSYGFLDCGYKQMYDRYNDVYRWVPLNGDMAGLCARTDDTNDAWWSPAGFNRGQVKNIVQLAWNPRKAHRDVLYPAGVNPVVAFPTQGVVLYGDKTMLAKPSAFSRINVRRLFIVLERAISEASQYTLFEFNDAFTRAQFKNMVNPFLRDIKGRRGIIDFLVVCDETNNTPQVIDTNRFIGDIYIKPARSINFIQLNFIAVPTGVAFSEVVGRFG